MAMELSELIKTVGYAGLFLIVFAESGLFFGCFLPGDSLLFTAGFLASQGYLDVSLLLLVFFVAAVAGDNVGYWFGEKYGKRLFEKKDSRFFKKEYLERAREFYKKHGGKAITLARFVPVVRTFTPIVAGIADMEYNKFFFYNLLGGLAWGVGMTLAGYFLGKTIPNADEYVLPIVAVIIIASLIPAWLHLNGAIRPEAKKPAKSRKFSHSAKSS